MEIKESLYKVTRVRKDDIKHKGFDFREQLFIRTMSKLLFREEKRAEILRRMEKVMVELIQSVKKIKTFFNYAVPKDYQDFN